MLQNLHTHINMCDGKNTPEEMIEKAIELGFDSLGFSSHAKTALNTSWELRSSAEEYIERISRLKDVYAGKIKIFLGAELDYFSKGVMPTDALDYTIGSVHTVIVNGEKVSFDSSYESSKRSVDSLFGGDSTEYARTYYGMVTKMAREMKYDIVGHFDLLTKFSEQHPEFINTDAKEYRDTALSALFEVRKHREFFEINTGAISRGYTTRPYPAPFLLKEMRAIGCKPVLTSDCHDARFLDCHFKEAKEYVSAHGFDTLYYLTENGFVGEKI